MKSPLQIISLAALLSLVWAAPKPVKDLHVTFIGKKYDVASATTTEEVQKAVQTQSGGDATTKLPQVIFGGKPLEPMAFLRDAGVTDGAELSALPDASAAAGGMADLMKQAGLDPEKLDELMSSMGGGAGGEGGMPSMEESMKMMSNMMNSPMIQEMMSDPERLEQSRQMILNNPMLKSMMAGMPGMGDLLNDPNAWKEAMQAAAAMYQNMDPNDMMSQMMNQMGNMDGLPPGAEGLFDGNLDNNAAAAALDELSEGED